MYIQQLGVIFNKSNHTVWTSFNVFVGSLCLAAASVFGAPSTKQASAISNSATMILISAIRDFRYLFEHDIGLYTFKIVVKRGTFYGVSGRMLCSQVFEQRSQLQECVYLFASLLIYHYRCTFVINVLWFYIN